MLALSLRINQFSEQIYYFPRLFFDGKNSQAQIDPTCARKNLGCFLPGR